MTLSAVWYMRGDGESKGEEEEVMQPGVLSIFKRAKVQKERIAKMPGLYWEG